MYGKESLIILLLIPSQPEVFLLPTLETDRQTDRQTKRDRDREKANIIISTHL